MIQSPGFTQFVAKEVITALASPPVQSVFVQGYIDAPVPAYTQMNAVAPSAIRLQVNTLLVL